MLNKANRPGLAMQGIRASPEGPFARVGRQPEWAFQYFHIFKDILYFLKKLLKKTLAIFYFHQYSANF
jgi:hypothetical protein